MNKTTAVTIVGLVGLLSLGSACLKLLEANRRLQEQYNTMKIKCDQLGLERLNEKMYREIYQTWLDFRIPDGSAQAMQYVQVACDVELNCRKRMMFSPEHPPSLPGVSPTGQLKYY